MLHGQGYDLDNNSHNLSHPFFPLWCAFSHSPLTPTPFTSNWSQAFFLNLIQGCESPQPASSTSGPFLKPEHYSSLQYTALSFHPGIPDREWKAGSLIFNV